MKLSDNNVGIAVGVAENDSGERPMTGMGFPIRTVEGEMKDPSVGRCWLSYGRRRKRHQDGCCGVWYGKSCKGEKIVFNG